VNPLGGDAPGNLRGFIQCRSKRGGDIAPAVACDMHAEIRRATDRARRFSKCRQGASSSPSTTIIIITTVTRLPVAEILL
jgi:hypothetical protein